MSCFPCRSSGSPTHTPLAPAAVTSSTSFITSLFFALNVPWFLSASHALPGSFDLASSSAANLSIFAAIALGSVFSLSLESPEDEEEEDDDDDAASHPLSTPKIARTMRNRPKRMNPPPKSVTERRLAVSRELANHFQIRRFELAREARAVEDRRLHH